MICPSMALNVLKSAAFVALSISSLTYAPLESGCWSDPGGSCLAAKIASPVRLRPRLSLLTSGYIFSSLSTMLLLAEILRRKTAQAARLGEQEQRCQDMATLGADFFWELDQDLRFIYLSGDLQHFGDPSDFLGKTPRQALAADENLCTDWNSFEELLSEHQTIENFILRLCDDRATVRIFKISARPFFRQEKRGRQQFQGYRGIQREITEEYQLTQTITYQATYDYLTGLINRKEFDRRLQQAVEKADQQGKSAFLAYLDLDQFKIVNDTAGHLVGDRLLTELAQMMVQDLRTSDSLGRLGGDEFGLLLEDCSLEEGQQICQRLVERVNSYRFTWQRRHFKVGVSIGLVPILEGMSNPAMLLSRADLACYKAKDLGRGRVYIARQDDTELEQRQTQLSHIASISQSIEENRFYLIQQPIVALNGESHKHVEILLRLTDEQGDTVSPGQFIPVAERYGMIGLVDRWVTETVLTNYHRYYPDLDTMVSINLSGSSLSDEQFTQFVVNLLEKSVIPAHQLCFEITETAAISQLDQAVTFINVLKRLGVSFALDDFGSGVSSFGYLQKLPVDYLKIDGTLIKNITTQHYERKIVDLVNQIASMMGMKTIAEFVETDAIITQLQALNVDYAQGYGIGKPIPIARTC